MLYNSCDNKKIKEIKKLNLKKYRDLENKYLVEGEHLVSEAYKRGVLETLIIEDGCDFRLNIDTMVVNHDVLKYIYIVKWHSRAHSYMYYFIYF